VQSGQRQIRQAMINVRTKGATFERDVVRHLNEFSLSSGLSYSACRNLDQYQAKGQCDIEIPFHAIECKHYKEGNWYRDAWWTQVCESAKGRIPVLIWKYNRQPIRVCVPLWAIQPEGLLDVSQTAVLTFDTWLDTMRSNWVIYSEKLNYGRSNSAKAA
jgi:hypothetical protein